MSSTSLRLSVRHRSVTPRRCARRDTPEWGTTQPEATSRCDGYPKETGSPITLRVMAPGDPALDEYRQLRDEKAADWRLITQTTVATLATSGAVFSSHTPSAPAT